MNGKARPLWDGAMATVRRRHSSRMALFIGLMVLATIEGTRSEYLMGGHMDNKEDQPGSPVPASRDDEEIAKQSPVISSRTATIVDDLDRDFDLELDLLPDRSSGDATRASSFSYSDDAASLDDESGISPRYRVPLAPYAFNGGQPFSLEKDPITGQIDFEKAPPLKALDYSKSSSEEDSSVADSESSPGADTDPSVDSKSHRDDGLGPNEINPYSPSFHDFLNLPSRYTYDKYENSEKYPLISSSYANTKVQSGGSSYNTYNHKKHHEAVKAGVDVASLYVQPMRKTYQPVTRSTTARTPSKPRPTTTTTTTTTTTEPSTTTTSTTTTTAPTSTKRAPSRYAPATTWRPQRPSLHVKYPADADYEGTLPIERLQTTSTEKPTSEPSPYVLPAKTSAPSSSNEDYGGYDDYDPFFQTVVKPSSENGQDDPDSDYGYGGLDLIGESDSRTSTEAAASSGSTTKKTPSSGAPTSSRTPDDPRPTSTTARNDDDFSTTLRPTTEEKRVTSMPLDTVNENYRPSYGSNAHQGGIDASLPSVTSNVVYQQLRPPSNDHHQFYPRPSLPLPSPGIVVKSTSNVVVPPGQDTVSFVLGNRQSVGSVSDTGTDYYAPVHSGSMSDRSPPIPFGNPRPLVPDNYPGQMVVSAGIGVGQNAVQTYNQRPYDHAVVSVGMPTVEVASAGEAPAGSGPGKNPDSSTNSLEAQGWWSPANSAAAAGQQAPQDSPSTQDQQFGYRVVFPDDGAKTPGAVEPIGNPTAPQRPIEEHVIVLHESDLPPGNSVTFELPSQPVSTPSPPTSFFREPTTTRAPGSKEDQQLLPELSESLTPPAERPRIPITSHRPPSYYNYYSHPPHGSGNSRPNDFRDQRPQRVPLPPQTSSSGFKRRQPSTSLESNLPNILPQFRPNAKTSHGHNRGETIGTIPAGAIGHYPATWFRRQPPHHHHHHRASPSRPRPSGPPHLQRLNPPPLPPLPPPPINSLRLPTPAALVAPPDLGISKDSQAQSSEEVLRLSLQKRLQDVGVGVPPSLAVDERHQGGQIKSRLEDDDVEKFSAEPPNQPPRAPFFSKVTSSADKLSEGIPRVATLQMIQQHGGREEDALRSNLPPPYRFSGDREDVAGPDDDLSPPGAVNRRGDSSTLDDSSIRGDAASPVYVVYPVKGALDIRPTAHGDEGEPDDDGSVVLGTYGSQRPLPPDTLLQDSHDGEESFSSVDPPAFADSSALASDFPYPLERPDPSMFTGQLREKPLLVPSDHGQRPNLQEEETRETLDRGDEGDHQEATSHDFDRDSSVNVIPYPQDHLPFALRDNIGAPISATLHRLAGSVGAASSTPIAYVYTPTMRSPVRRPDEVYHHVGFERPVLLPSQQASSSSSSAPAPQSFMAPFVASASAEAPTKNGWSVVVVGEPDGSSMDRRGETNIRGDGDEESGPGAAEDDDDDGPKKNSGEPEEEKKNVRGDEDTKIGDANDERDAQTEKSEFDVENFTPQLFGGFKPIYEFPADTETMGDKVSGEAIVERPRSNSGDD